MAKAEIIKPVTDDISKPNEVNKGDKPHLKGIDINEVIALRVEGHSLDKIAEYLGCSKANIHKRLEPYKDDIDGLSFYKRNRSNVLSIHQSRMLEQLTPTKIKEMNALQITTAFGILYDKERLETGQSTSNTSVLATVVQGIHEKL